MIAICGASHGNLLGAATASTYRPMITPKKIQVGALIALNLENQTGVAINIKIITFFLSGMLADHERPPSHGLQSCDVVAVTRRSPRPWATPTQDGLHQGVTKLNLLQPRLVFQLRAPSTIAICTCPILCDCESRPIDSGTNQGSLQSSSSPLPRLDRRRRLPLSNPPPTRSSVFVNDNHIHHVGPARVVVLLYHPENSVQHHRRHQWSSCHS